MSCQHPCSSLVLDCRHVTYRVAGCAAIMFVLAGLIPIAAQQSVDADSGQTATSQRPSLPTSSPQTQVQTPSAEPGQSPVPLPVPKKHKLNCRHAANPTKRRFGCKDEEFDWEETLTQDWIGARAEAKRLGITPSGSYYSALQTNAMNSSHPMWGYVGQLTTAVDFDFEKLLKLHGTSLYFSDSWGTGSNLTAAIGSVFPVNPNYAVGAYLGEIYLQQKAVNGKLTFAAGRLYLIMYLLMFGAAIYLRHSQPNRKRTFSVPGGLIGMWIIGGAGLLGSLLAFILSFVPPSQIAVGSPAKYIGILVVGNLIVVAIPFIIFSLRKPSWQSTSVEDAMEPFSWEKPAVTEVAPETKDLVCQ